MKANSCRADKTIQSYSRTATSAVLLGSGLLQILPYFSKPCGVYHYMQKHFCS